MMSYTRVLTIAGSDSGGGAGVQADLKTFSALGCYGMSVITAVTAQNTREVTAVMPVPSDIVTAQLDAVFSDIGVDAVKIGMLHNDRTIEAVASALRRWNARPVVLDTVMVAKSGDHLLNQNAIASLRTQLLPLADIITPNLPEAEALLGREIADRNAMEQAARDLLELGPAAVLVKGGHLTSDDVCPDVLAQKGYKAVRWFENRRILTINTHGTGCTLSAAIAANLAQGKSLIQAVTDSRAYLQNAIEQGAKYKFGRGHGPVDHLYQVRQS